MAFRLWKRGVVLPVLIALSVVLVACGGQGGGNGIRGGTAFSTEIVPQQIPVGADPSGALRWDKAAYEATAGDITFVVSNPSPLPHQFSVEGNGVTYRSPDITPGSTNRYTIKGLAAGTYQIVCNFPGHKAAGMVATLTVR